MGIPSYYKKLADHTKGLISKTCPEKPSAVYFDFNCLIYHVARRPNSTLPPYPGYEAGFEWEQMLLEDIVKYVVKVWQAVGSPSEVFLGVDGVVPMAKIKQQRLRRFKSVWLATEEIKEGTRTNEPHWDTNCITPGTSFMKRLTTKLQQLCAKHANWSMSGAEEPGEGEHKVMAKLRQRAPDAGPLCIYGLDADLILLTLLNSKSSAYLVREESVMGAVHLNSFGEEDYSFFSIDVLKQTIPSTISIETYITAMTLLGNDFLPHSLTVKIKDEGHTVLLRTLESLQTPLVEQKDGIWIVNHDTLYSIFENWSKTEEQRMLHTFKKKAQMQGRTQAILDTKPLQWFVEKPLVTKNQEGWCIHPSWRDVYHKQWLQCETPSEIHEVCREYMYGLQWVLDYYTGQRVVDMQWCFSRLVPPLWSDLAEYLERGLYEDIPRKDIHPIQPHEQLAMVLPLESWHYQQDLSLRTLPSLLPQFWPQTFGFFSAGRLHMWECEPYLPVLHVERVRGALAALKA